MGGFFIWWYGQGLVVAWKVAYWLLDRVSDFFSLEILVKTWFAPWKNDVLSARNVALSDQVKLWEMNLVSRLVGFVLRTVVLAIGLAFVSLISLATTGILVIWILAPVLVFIFPAIGVAIYRLS